MRRLAYPYLTAALFGISILQVPGGAAARAGATDEDVRAAIETYCLAVKDAAAERRMAAQAAMLKELEARIETRVDLLESEKKALEDLIRRGEELRNLAERELVEIYAGMDPEASASQMEALDVRLASSVLRQLKPRQASLILNEMKPELAARMVKLIASTGKADEKKQ